MGKVALASTNAYGKGSWEPHDCGRRWQTQIWANVEEEWMKKRKVFSWTWKVKEYIKYAAVCGQTASGSCHTRYKILNIWYEVVLEKHADVIWYPNQQVCGGHVRMIQKRRWT